VKTHILFESGKHVLGRLDEIGSPEGGVKLVGSLSLVIMDDLSKHAGALLSRPSMTKQQPP
jgi:hypothetical protein